MKLVVVSQAIFAKFELRRKKRYTGAGLAFQWRYLSWNFPQRLKILDLVLCFFSFFFLFFLPFPLPPPPPFHRQTVRSLVFSPTTTPVCPFAIPWINNWTNMRVRKHDENFNRWLSVRSLVQNYLLISLFHRLFHTLYFTLPSLFLTVSISIFLYGSGRESCDKEFFAQLPY